jgi:hypothetical protein
MTMPWIPIRYRDFFDIPRAFVVEYTGDLYFFDCPFDQRVDEYPDHYDVYCPKASVSLDLTADWWQSFGAGGSFVGTVPTQQVQFDVTRRAAVDESIFDLLHERS